MSDAATYLIPWPPRYPDSYAGHLRPSLASQLNLHPDSKAFSDLLVSPSDSQMMLKS